MMKALRFLLFLLAVTTMALAFTPPFQLQQKRWQCHPSRLLYYNKFDDSSFSSSTSVNAQNRMELVRKLQNLYYQNETKVDHDHFGVYDNMPILRSNRVELPGFQGLYNITDPLEIHMFLKVVHSKPPKLFGHLYQREDYYHDYSALEEQDTTTTTPAPRDDKYNVGTLMQVSDYRQDTDTGHLLVLVQALARFVVVGGSTERWDWMSLEHFHYHDTPTQQQQQQQHQQHQQQHQQQQQQQQQQRRRYHHRYKPTVERASVELLPDEELVHYFRQTAQETADSYDFSRNQDVQGAACAGAIAEASQWRFFETQPQCIPIPGGQPLDPVASLSPQPVTVIPQNAQMVMQEYLSQSPMDLHQGECSLYPNDDDDDNDDDDNNDDHENNPHENVQHVLDVERSVWLELDKLVKNLSQLNPKANTEMPIPTQILSLMPYRNTQWPYDFGLAKYVQQLVRAHAVLAKNKYKQANGFQLVPREYPPLRRARRLSYILWNVFLEQDTMDVPSGEMQRVLEIHSISSRLQAGHLQLQTINRILHTLIES
jgi:hypothetical protein